MPRGLNILPSIWQSYIMLFQSASSVGNIVRQLWMTYCCLPPKKGPHIQIRGLTEGITENGLKISL